MKRFLTKSTIAAGIVLTGAIVSHPAIAAPVPVTTPNFDITIEAPGVQTSTLTNSSSGAKGVYVENFDSQSTGYNGNGFAFANNSAIGSYDKGDIVPASLFGGAGGTGKYLTVQPGQLGSPSTYTQSTLTLKNPERYFGFEWSAGDANNELDFYSGNKLLEAFTTSDVISFINKQPNAKSYYGNPNSQFKGQDAGEPFAFINFFANSNDPTVTFDKIVFVNKTGSTGFESDNHTIASSYNTISGTNIRDVPEPSVLLGLGLVAGIGVLSQKRRIWKQV